MIYVCKEHLIKGIHSIQVPHVEKASSTKFVCQFCRKEVNYKLFIPMLKKKLVSH
ncbi:hypothetical protein BAOM_2789 [Peribacillus asahii]|uniref:Uncharacterized protein n=1 Tax=Peribacillus asahii TaxID=228899 RepID=A0A3T0KSW2_9BACI|nr:hypothetical protein BAOM_2789 [Peribacillus asahii]